MGMNANERDAEFTSFVSAHSGTLRRTAQLLTGHRQAAEDLLQDALAKTWLAWPKIDPVAAWAYTRKIMVNLATDRWRRRRYETVTVDIDDRTPSTSDGGFAAADDRAFIVRQLAQLTARERAAVVLRYYHDLPESDVARVLGCSVGTVKSTCSRALARLRSRGEAALSTRSQS